MTTWLDTIDSNRFDLWTRTTLITEAQRTRFPGDLPAWFEFLGGGFVDLGFEKIGLSAAELDAVRQAFVNDGVSVPGTGFRLRHIRPGCSVVELKDGREAAALPIHWRRGISMIAGTGVHN